jgi:hypothetical protein
MRVFAYTKAFFCWRKFHRTSMIEKQKRADKRRQVRISEKRPHGEAVANPVLLSPALDAR